GSITRSASAVLRPASPVQTRCALNRLSTDNSRELYQSKASAATAQPTSTTSVLMPPMLARPRSYASALSLVGLTTSPSRRETKAGFSAGGCAPSESTATRLAASGATAGSTRGGFAASLAGCSCLLSAAAA